MPLMPLMALLAIAGCIPAEPPRDGPKAWRQHSNAPPNQAPLKVAVTTAALASCARAIGADQVEVLPLVRSAGEVPSRGALVEAQGADLILLNGADHEPWLPAVSLPTDALLDSSQGAPPPPEDPHAGLHRHGPEGERHSHGSPAFTWLDLKAVRHQCQRTHQALAQRLPAQKGPLAERHQAVQRELSALDAELTAATGRLKSIGMVAAGSGYRSFAQAYGLPLRFTRHRPGSDPSAGSDPSGGGDVLFLQELDGLAASGPLQIVVLPAEPSAQLRESLSDRGVKVLVLDPLDASSEGGFMEGMRRNVVALSEYQPGTK